MNLKPYIPAQESYASLRARHEPNPLLVQALDLLEARNGHALDVGAGPLNDTRCLLRAGLSVDAVDTDAYTVSLAAKVGDPRLRVRHADIRDVPIASEAYSLIVAIHVLPFLLRGDLDEVLPSIIGGLCDGGILCCTFLGTDDSWAGRRPHMTFLSRRQLDTLLSGLDRIVFSEDRYDGRNARGEPKRWHVHRCICRKAASVTQPTWQSNP